MCHFVCQLLFAALYTDYTVTPPFEVTFSPDSGGLVTTQSFSGIESQNDDSIEGPHSFNVLLQSIPAQFMDNVKLDSTPQRVTIIDDDGKCIMHHNNYKEYFLVHEYCFSQLSCMHVRILYCA